MSNHIVVAVADCIRQYIPEISFGITAVTLMLAGPIINRTVKLLSRSLHWLLRYAIFIMLCTVVYGFLSQAIYRSLRIWFVNLDNMMLDFWVCVIYLGLAWFAKRQHEI